MGELTLHIDNPMISRNSTESKVVRIRLEPIFGVALVHVLKNRLASVVVDDKSTD